MLIYWHHEANKYDAAVYFALECTDLQQRIDV